mmetsp:Transcript_22081/g.71447  ORF Transcript_22081/g.71447 Transcript_22081/m.71447 type:complete len:83 (+) Transcript_22081:293-541(+)
MSAHAGQFDENVSKRLRNPECGLAPDAGRDNGKVRAGNGDGKVVLPQSVREALDERWAGVVLPETGCASYAALLEKTRAERL